jgi:PAS domain S-box-containing protein
VKTPSNPGPPGSRPFTPDVAADALWNLVPDGLLAIDPNGRITAANDAAATMFGAAGGELVGQQVESLLDRRARAAHQVAREGWNRVPRPRVMSAGRTFDARTLDGRTIQVQVALNPIQWHESLLTVAVIRDVTNDTAARREQAIVRDQIVQTLFGLTMSLRSVISAVEPIDTAGRIAAVVDGMGDVADALDRDRERGASPGSAGPRSLDATAGLGDPGSTDAQGNREQP